MGYQGVGELEGCVVIVTGSARNIGRCIALELADAGAAVVIHTRTDLDAARSVEREIVDSGGQAMTHAADVGDPEQVRGLVDAALAKFGRIDILVNNAASRGDAPLENIAFEDWRKVHSSILDGAFLCSQACAPHLSANGRGAIVNIGGVAGQAAVGGRAHVVAAKAGIAGLTRALAAELADSDITVNCISPGYIDTKRDHVPPHFRDRPVPLKRPGKPEEIAAAVRFMCGPNARYITGQTLGVNGGWHMN